MLARRLCCRRDDWVVGNENRIFSDAAFDEKGKCSLLLAFSHQRGIQAGPTKAHPHQIQWEKNVDKEIEYTYIAAYRISS